MSDHHGCEGCCTWDYDFQRTWRDACGVFGIQAPGTEDLARLCYFGLFALQHRGQESAGIAVGNAEGIDVYTGMGLANEVFNDEIIQRLQGDVALGHVRYSTTGSNVIENAQPFVGEHRSGMFAVAHNGNLVNALPLRQELLARGVRFEATSDTEVITQLIANSSQDRLEDAIAEAMLRMQGAYSLGIIAPDRLIAVRDPHGLRPLCVGGSTAISG